MARKRKAPRAAEREANDDESAVANTSHSVLGGMKGGYRVDVSDKPKGVNAEHFTVPFNDKEIICERRGQGAKPALVFTHGAGGGIANPATSDFASGFGEVSPIVTFQGTMNLQSRIKTFNAVIEHEKFDLALGGRSMGARAATITAAQDDRKTKALVLVSYPLVGGKNNDEREQILLDLDGSVDVLFVTGSKDAQCDLAMLEKTTEKMKAKSWIMTVEGADHGMSWKWKNSVQVMRRRTGEVAAEWLKSRKPGERRYELSWSEEEESLFCTEWQNVIEAAPQSLDDGRRASKRPKRGKADTRAEELETG